MRCSGPACQCAFAAAALIAAKVPRQTPHQDPVDSGGAVLLTAGTGALLYGIIEAPGRGWAAWQVVGSLLLALTLLAAFVSYELRRPHPMLDPRLFRLPGVRAGALGIVALFFALFGLFYVNAQYLQDVKGYSALLTGVCVLPVAVAMPFASARSTRLVERIGAQATIVLGMAAVALGLLLVSLATAETPYALYAASLVVVSAGMGLAMPPLSGLMVHALPPTHAGVASGLNGTTRELGSALGVAVVSSIFGARFADRLPDPLRDLPGPPGAAIRGSIAAALQHAERAPDPTVRARLIDGTRDAFTHATAVGLRVGAVLILVTTLVVVTQHSTIQRKDAS